MKYICVYVQMRVDIKGVYACVCAESSDIYVITAMQSFREDTASTIEIATFDLKLVATAMEHKRTELQKVKQLLSRWKICLLPSYSHFYKR